jgi:hypothetical protein
MPSLTPDNRSQLLAAIRADQSEHWQRGVLVCVEYYLSQHPELASDSEAVGALVDAEVLLRLEQGESPSLDEYLGRFPQHAGPLRLRWTHLRLAHPQLRTHAEENQRTVSETRAGSRASPAAPPLSLPGFELFERLGEGGMGIVFRARDIRLDQPRAIKVIRTGPFASEDARQRFSTEAKAVARLDHPGVVRIFSLGEHDDVLFICMELLEGGSLQARLRREPMEVREAAELVRQLAVAVQHAHEAGVLHRDLKPANVLLTASGEPKVTDFGLAKLLDADDGITHTGAVMGTPSYMAPEQAEGRTRDVGQPTDGYALGAILYECLTGRPPFRTESRQETLDLVKRDPPIPPGRLRSEVPVALEAICLKCLAKDPRQRYPSALALAADLQDWLEGKIVPIPAVRQPARRWLVAACAVVCLAGLATAGYLLRPSGEQPATGDKRMPAVESSLLAREPLALHWPAKAENSLKIYRANEQELMLTCQGLGLLALGETTATRYRLAITMHQSPWAGNIGLFLGYKECQDREKPGRCYQVIVLTAMPQKEGERLFRLSWRAVQLPEPVSSGREISRYLRVSSRFRLTGDTHRLELAVGPNGLEAVSWDGAVQPELRAAAADSPPAPADYKGKFGIYTNRGNGVFRDAQYHVQEEP